MKITFIADTHYYSKSLGTSGKAYELRSGSDQKCLAETGEIIDAAFQQIANSDTDAVFILGDVTNDGEMVSHLEFREKLYQLQKKKPVYLITATHDWCCDENPRRFEGDKTFHDVPVMKSSDLPAFYKDFGPAQAADSFITDIGTVCYTIQLSDKIRVLCLNDDKNENDHAGFTPACRTWIVRQLQKAKADGAPSVLLQYTDQELSAILEERPYYYQEIIPAGTYKDQTKDVATFGTKCLLCVNEDMDEELVYQITSVLYEGRERLGEAHPAMQFMAEGGFMYQKLPIKLHPGALRFYQEQGLLPVEQGTPN